MNYNITNIYEYFDSTSNIEIDRTTFKNICSDFNMMIIDYILDGGKFNMGNSLSYISILRIDRNNSKPAINWGESNKYKNQLKEKGIKLYNHTTGEGQKWYIYYTDSEYCRYYWNKASCKIPNKSVYKFIPTRGLKGNKEKLTALLKKDDLAYLKFKKHNNYGT
tara:strand:+ start:1933 stop:2424 length:492 start_codon:yes stop_codon:yes gene_type:complete